MLVFEKVDSKTQKFRKTLKTYPQNNDIFSSLVGYVDENMLINPPYKFQMVRIIIKGEIPWKSRDSLFACPSCRLYVRMQIVSAMLVGFKCHVDFRSHSRRFQVPQRQILGHRRFEVPQQILGAIVVEFWSHGRRFFR